MVNLAGRKLFLKEIGIESTPTFISTTPSAPRLPRLNSKVYVKSSIFVKDEKDLKSIWL